MSKEELMDGSAFPHVIDSTMINDFRRCPQRFAETYVNSIRLPGENVDLMFGSCFAKGVEVARRHFYTDSGDSDVAASLGIQAAVREWGDFDEPQGHVKSVQTLMLALDGYFKQWPFTHPPYPVDNNAIEYTFGVPLLIKHPDTGAEIIYGGRFDMLGTDGTLIYPVDEKTTGSSFFNWAEGWHLWGQFIGYIWACKTHGIAVDNLLVRGIKIGKNDCKYIQHFVPCTDIVIMRWYDDLIETIEQMIYMYKRGKFNRVYGTACKVYKPCAYLPLCEATKRSDWITMYKQVEQWNPLAKPGGEL